MLLCDVLSSPLHLSLSSYPRTKPDLLTQLPILIHTLLVLYPIVSDANDLSSHEDVPARISNVPLPLGSIYCF